MANIPEPLVHYFFSEETMRRNNVRAMFDQVRIGIARLQAGGRSALHAYAATSLPLLEAALPTPLRTRFVAFNGLAN